MLGPLVPVVLIDRRRGRVCTMGQRAHVAEDGPDGNQAQQQAHDRASPHHRMSCSAQRTPRRAAGDRARLEWVG